MLKIKTLILIPAAITVIINLLKISMSMKLKSILTLKSVLKKENLLEEIVQQLKLEIIQGKLLQIWIVKEKNEEFITIMNNDDNNNNNDIQINISCLMGKNLLTKIICAITKRNKKTNYPPFFIVLKKDDINVRKTFLKFNKKVCDFNFFKFLMRCFIIVNQQQYIKLKR